MSKASEYANKVKDLKQIEFVNKKGSLVASVNSDGTLMTYTSIFDPWEALEYADWIIDIFGEIK